MGWNGVEWEGWKGGMGGMEERNGSRIDELRCLYV
jgi:hypothetical protein